MKLNHLLHTFRSSRAALLAAIALAGIGTANAANFFDNTISGINLGNASGGTTGGHRNWAIFALSGGVAISNTSLDAPYEVLGNVGMAGAGSLTMTLTEIKGTVYKSTGSYNGGGTITGGTPITDTSYVTTAASNATAASNTATSLATYTAGLGVSGSVTSAMLTTGASILLNGVSGGITDKGVAGTYVLNLTNLSLSGIGAILTLTGTSSTNYVINVAASLALTGTGSQIVLSGGLTPQNVLFNVKNNVTTPAVTLSGGATLNGIILATNRAVNLNGASKVFGEVIGNSVSLSGSSHVYNPLVSP